MRKRTTQGQNVAEWERKKDEKDERDWQNLVEGAIDREDYLWLEELIIDGLREGYEIPDVSDPVAQSIIERYSHCM